MNNIVVLYPLRKLEGDLCTALAMTLRAGEHGDYSIRDKKLYIGPYDAALTGLAGHVMTYLLT